MIIFRKSVNKDFCSVQVLYSLSRLFSISGCEYCIYKATNMKILNKIFHSVNWIG
jgi:hypothetical protein